MSAPKAKHVVTVDRKVVATFTTKKAARTDCRSRRANGEVAFTYSLADYKKFINPAVEL